MLRFFPAWLCCMLCLLIAPISFAADSSAVQLSFVKQRTSEKEVVVFIKAFIPEGYRLYSVQKLEENGLYSSVIFDSSKYLNGTLIEKGKTQFEENRVVNAKSAFYVDSVTWMQRLTIPQMDSTVVKGKINYLYKKGDEYIPEERAFKIHITPEIPKKEALTVNAVHMHSLLWIFVSAFAGGLLALLTPCVYSMIPVTVSFFTKRSKSRSEGIKNSLYYSVSIVSIFTLLGFIVTLVFGPAALNTLATNWIANLVFFAVFILFGISFLGAFEITLPSSWANRADRHAGLGSFIGIFFMALTLVVVSFSCTGPIIGNLLVLAAKGSYWGPLTGMLGFSSALALPFALFAFFPSKLNMLGKAGGWLNVVKVTLGFLELALALKFLSNADLVKGWRLLDREIFLSAWIVLFTLLGIYLLGKLKLRHDDQLPPNDFGLPHLSVSRLMFAVAAFLFSVYMVPGLWGAPLKAISAFLPPMGTQDFSYSASPVPVNNKAGIEKKIERKYQAAMSMYEPEVVTKYGLVTYFDYNEALAVANKENKPLMIDFTGINCVNCRKMEGQVWSDPEVMRRLKDRFIIVSLYVDVKNIELPEAEQYYSKALNKPVETLGDWNTDLQVTRFGANTQPYYFFLDSSGNRLEPEGYGYDPDVQKFIRLLDKVSLNFHQKSL